MLDCIIIGAGASGLVAAATLHEAGRLFAVVEARGFIGGRANSRPLSDGTPVERGAQQLHGPTIATWEFVVRHRLRTHYLQPGTRGADAVFRDGKWTGGDPARREAYARIIVALKDMPGLLVADSMSLHEALVKAGFKGAMLETAEFRYNVLCPIDPKELSARAAAEALRFNGTGLPNFAIVDGHSKLWEMVSRPFAAKVHLNTPVSEVAWGPEGVKVAALRQAQGERLRLEARTAIVTLPVGVLQAGTVRFTPGLPKRKTEALKGLRMGSTIKVIGEFRRPFWEARAGRGPGFRAEGSVFHWFEDMFWDRPGPSVLSAMIGRKGAELSGDEGRIRAAYLSEIAKMFPEADVESELVDIEVVDWTADAHARGSLSVAPVGGQRLREDLAAPTPPLFWAGEATNAQGNAMAVHGAVEAGRRAAIEVFHAVQPLHSTDEASRLDWWKHTTIPGQFVGGR